MEIFCGVMESLIGGLKIFATQNEILCVDFVEKGEEIEVRENTLIRECKRQLEEYFLGKREKFDLPLRILGSEFERAVYRELLKIPYGEVRTYAQVAQNINKPKAFRAVGNANGKNKIAILIPCHRVVAKGGMGGYNGGLDKKIKLLNLERK
ncbi:methylated-DNA--[protein]-cysteine S-methyltransferase [Helicobacter burdigaliensis]|uniref:methylated-DNA--[protein]-cysteine S-methyltransferase n=1 Tax=Helicobacter burdigaliensis TaxID=2315334 RepID=UPI001E3F402D|nr:methylated-DNA--[protein]-cysteine S-methyltransferase [Helicobacter burdigaliensis]